MNFRINFTVLYPFPETGTSDRCLICIVQQLRFSVFSLYPLLVFLYSKFKKRFAYRSKTLFINIRSTTLS